MPEEIRGSSLHPIPCSLVMDLRKTTELKVLYPAFHCCVPFSSCHPRLISGSFSPLLECSAKQYLAEALNLSLGERREAAFLCVAPDWETDSSKGLQDPVWEAQLKESIGDPVLLTTQAYFLKKDNRYLVTQKSGVDAVLQPGDPLLFSGASLSEFPSNPGYCLG